MLSRARVQPSALRSLEAVMSHCHARGRARIRAGHGLQDHRGLARLSSAKGAHLGRGGSNDREIRLEDRLVTSLCALVHPVLPQVLESGDRDLPVAGSLR